ncbi:MAG: hypothetical protein LUG46_08355 [Erysipelotrichaceae bacterium]|nr:hypothetical protein [Erysipelotrichaceae bacterium]
MLENDIPAVISNYSMNKQLPLYLFQDCNYVNNKYGSNTKPWTVKSHYMVGTCLIQYSDDVSRMLGHKTMLGISTYGREFYIDYEQYSDGLGFTTNIFNVVK